jgi:hypothetical protein
MGTGGVCRACIYTHTRTELCRHIYTKEANLHENTPSGHCLAQETGGVRDFVRQKAKWGTPLRKPLLVYVPRSLSWVRCSACVYECVYVCMCVFEYPSLVYMPRSLSLVRCSACGQAYMYVCIYACMHAQSLVRCSACV